MLRTSLLFSLAVTWANLSVQADDWPRWGGTPAHNMVSPARGLPETFRLGPIDPETSEMDLAKGEHLKWVVKLGTETHGSPVVIGGKLLIGTNNPPARGAKANRNAHVPGGWLLCVDAQTGQPVWDLVTPKLPEKRAPHSDTGYGICASATVEGERIYLVTNDAEVLCLDLRGMANGNDGPFQDEGRYMAGAFNDPQGAVPAVEVKPTDADILWRYDLLAEHDVHPHDASSSSVLVLDDLLYVCTGNGINREEDKVLNPLAPSLIVLDKQTGKLVAADDEKIGTRLLKGQWTSPSLCQVGGRPLIIYGGGDGLCYAFEPVRRLAAGQPTVLKKVWAVDCNPPDCRLRNGKPVTYREKDGPSEIIGTPVCLGERVYVTIGRDPHRGAGKGCVTCLDAARGAAVWSCDKIGRSMSTVSVLDGLLYVGETFGAVHCLDAATGESVWSHKVDGQIWGSTMVADGKVYLPYSKGLLVFATGNEKKLLATIKLDSPCLSTPCAVDGVLYVATQEYLYAVSRMGP
jgi:outer membrane protein assembly factor BamB